MSDTTKIQAVGHAIACHESGYMGDRLMKARITFAVAAVAVLSLAASAQDAARIQAMFDVAREWGGTVRIPPGTYRLETPVNGRDIHNAEIEAVGVTLLPRFDSDAAVNWPALDLVGSSHLIVTGAVLDNTVRMDLSSGDWRSRVEPAVGILCARNAAGVSANFIELRSITVLGWWSVANVYNRGCENFTLKGSELRNSRDGWCYMTSPRNVFGVVSPFGEFSAKTCVLQWITNTAMVSEYPTQPGDLHGCMYIAAGAEWIYVRECAFISKFHPIDSAILVAAEQAGIKRCRYLTFTDIYGETEEVAYALRVEPGMQLPNLTWRNVSLQWRVAEAVGVSVDPAPAGSVEGE